MRDAIGQFVVRLNYTLNTQANDRPMYLARARRHTRVWARRRGSWTDVYSLREAHVFESLAEARIALRSKICREFKNRGGVLTVHIVRVNKNRTRELGAEIWPTVENPIDGLAVLS